MLRPYLGPGFWRRRQRKANNPAERLATDTAYSESEESGDFAYRDSAYRASRDHGNKQGLRRLLVPEQRGSGV
jgi:hypothetical protein